MNGAEIYQGICQIVMKHCPDSTATVDAATVRALRLEIYEVVWTEAHRTAPCPHPMNRWHKRGSDGNQFIICLECGRVVENDKATDASAKNTPNL
jgi:hypothetical protein